MDQQGVRRDAAGAIRISAGVVEERGDRGDQPAGDVGVADEESVQASSGTSAGEDDQQVNQDRDREAVGGESDRGGEGNVGDLELRQEPGEAHADHQQADEVAGPPVPGEEAGADEGPADQQREDRLEQRHLSGLALRHHHERRNTEQDSGDPQGDQGSPQRCHRAHATSSSIAEAVSSSFGMKPSAPLVVTSGPSWSRGRLEVRITTGPPFAESLPARSIPLASGS